MKRRTHLTVAAAVLAVVGGVAVMAEAGDTSASQLIAEFSAEAGVTPSPARGEALFMARHSGGKPETPSCTTCHTKNPKTSGKTRAGKAIEPMALSVNPMRFTDSAKVAKWFRRNCNSVLGRECSAGEKADVLAWLAGL